MKLSITFEASGKIVSKGCITDVGIGSKISFVPHITSRLEISKGVVVLVENGTGFIPYTTEALNGKRVKMSDGSEGTFIPESCVPKLQRCGNV